MSKPRSIQSQFQNAIDTIIAGLLATTPYYDMRSEIHGYIADTRRGRANTDDMDFTIPYWAYNPDYKHNKKTNGCGYFIYYVAHELSHLIAFKKYGGKVHHDYRFYEVFMSICPKEYQHFELGYKNGATKYGINKK